MCAKLQLSSLEQTKTLQEALRILGAPFHGFARLEAKTYWAPRVLARYAIPAVAFTERDVQGQEHTFPLAEGSRVFVLKVRSPQTDLPEIRVVTQEAKGPAAQVHHRMPVILPPRSGSARVTQGRPGSARGSPGEPGSDRGSPGQPGPARTVATCRPADVWDA
jgi:hypothetical protein